MAVEQRLGPPDRPIDRGSIEHKHRAAVYSQSTNRFGKKYLLKENLKNSEDNCCLEIGKYNKEFVIAGRNCKSPRSVKPRELIRSTRIAAHRGRINQEVQQVVNGGSDISAHMTRELFHIYP